eukprot:TRINITY_DN9077_c0_g1_i1.p1 TRINITY_DN9077_c0_g1~~TRINITY_DN9077_c0_g1_i1.p1  ORF type:complete len:274 (+),score=55.61 TRINITY_DN9077_c0_g1_i1:33-824(+)
MEVKGKTALVTGASSGIGLSFARLFLNLGGNVVGADVVSTPESSLLETTEFPGKFFHTRCDVSSFKSIEAAFKFTIEKFGGVDVVVNNAGVAGNPEHPFLSRKPITEEDVKDWDRVIRIDLDGVVYGTALAIRLISNPGVILNMASMAGLSPLPGGPDYAAAKHGVVGLTRSVHSYLRKHGVRAYAICPSYTKSGITAQAAAQVKNFGAILNAVSKGKGLMETDFVAQAMIDLVEHDPGQSQNKVVQMITPDGGIQFHTFGKL